MRHRKIRSKLSMKTARRDATMNNMVKSLFKYQGIKTTLARAKVARRLAERMMTLTKSDTVEARRRAYAVLGERDMVAKLFGEIAALSKDRASGFTRIVKLGFRLGDGAEMAILELTDKKIVDKLPKKKKEKKAPNEAQSAKPKAESEKKETAAGQKPEKEEHREPKAKTIQKTKPTLEEEKRSERARSEDKKAHDKRGFMKNIRGLFRKRGDF